MPKINSPDQVANLVPNLPHRLRELRLEMGWSLEDLVPIVGVTQKGVVSNWEATNQRRRTPPITTLVILQRWYGVSLEYLIGLPKAERDSTAVKEGRQALKEKLGLIAAPPISPSDRARLALKCACEVAPEAFFLERAAAYLGLSVSNLQGVLRDLEWHDTSLRRLAEFLGIPLEWFYSREAASVQVPEKKERPAL